VKKVLGILGVLLLLLILYGALIEPRLLMDKREEKAYVPNLPADWNGKRIALIADFQTGMWWDNTGMVSKIVKEITQSDVDAVLIAGDLVYKPDTSVVDEAVGLLKPLADSQIPVYAVLGNHDYSLMKKKSQKRPEIAGYLEAELEAINIKVLENESVNVGTGAEPLHIVGIGSEWADNSQVGIAMSKVGSNDARIIFMHNPVAYRDLPANSAPLTLAAHTHGGQIRLPFTPRNNWLDIARDREVVADGWSTDKVGAEGNRLYVNRGIGFSLVPIRLFCRPELTIFTLQSSPAGLEDKDPGAAE
jgi:predicted MPP superfamily phosphohydrolase